MKETFKRNTRKKEKQVKMLYKIEVEERTKRLGNKVEKMSQLIRFFNSLKTIPSDIKRNNKTSFVVTMLIILQS